MCLKMDDCPELVLKTICCTCLSRDRKLAQLCKLPDGVNNLYLLLSYDNEAYREGFYKDSASLFICWECQALMSKVTKFRTQACSVQKVLTDITEGRTDNFKSKLQKPGSNRRRAPPMTGHTPIGYLCPECNKCFEYPCKECGKTFAKITAANNHYNYIHKKETKFICEPCNRFFLNGFRLRQHQASVHMNIRPLKNKLCGYCGRSFSANRILENHIRTHTGERPFKCSHCPAAFSQKQALTTHTRAIHKICNK